MATLAEQLETDYTALKVGSVDEETDLTRTCEIAAARVIRFGGNDDGDDTQAVDIGLEYLRYLLSKSSKLVYDAQAQAWFKQIDDDLMDLRDSRRQEASDA